MVQLPDEIWLQIFQLALDNHQVPEYTLFDSTSLSSWFRMMLRKWALRAPTESLLITFEERYKILKTISSTSRHWRQLVAEYLFEVLCFKNSVSVKEFSSLIEEEPSIGKWVRRIYIMRYVGAGHKNMLDTTTALTSILKHCKGIEMLFVDMPLVDSFTSIADVICTCRPRKLQSIHLNLSNEHLRDFILVLDTLSSSLAHVYIELSGSIHEETKLGAVSAMVITFPKLRQLSLRGLIMDLVEEISSWLLPSLEMLTLDFTHYHDGLPDIEEFLVTHGSQLTFLDINSIDAMDVPSLLELCPRLRSFSFNADWRLLGNQFGEARLVRAPHPNITFIGCHGLGYAFGVFSTVAFNPITVRYMQQCNDMNISALNKLNFPNLAQVRVLSRTLLHDLEAFDGPTAACYGRWERWRDQCDQQGIRLEDCTGANLGTLPEIEDEDWLEEEEVEEEYLHLEGADDPLTVIRNLRQELQQAVASIEEPSSVDPYSPVWEMVGNHS